MMWMYPLENKDISGLGKGILLTEFDRILSNLLFQSIVLYKLRLPAVI